MSTKIYANARFGLREDTLKNWMINNPVLEKGEPAVVRDGEDGEWLKIGDGVTSFNKLPWKKGPKGDKGEQGIQGDKGDKGDKGDTGADGEDAVTDQTYNPESENAQSGIAVAEAINLFDQSKQKNYELIATITVTPDENGDLPTSIIFSADSDGNTFKLTDFYILSLIGGTDGTSARATVLVNNQGVFGGYGFGSTLSSSALRSWYMQWINLGDNNGALCVVPGITNYATTLPITSNVNGAAISGGLILPSFTRYFPVEKIEIKLTGGGAKTFIENSKFELWGVKQ